MIFYAELNNMKFNTQKSKCMCLQPKNIQTKIVQKLTLSSTALSFVSEHNYLGVTLCTNMCNDYSIDKQCKRLYARGNLLLWHLRHCSEDVKVLLFNSYSTALYGAALWCTFRSEYVCHLRTA